MQESEGDLEYAAFEENHRFQVPKGAHWKEVRENTVNVGLAIQDAMRAIEQANPDTLYGIFGDASWTNKNRLSDEILTDLIEHFSQHTLNLANVPDDQLGNAYEYLIKEFADDSGHTAAEFYTNRTVVKLMTLIMDPQPGDRVLDLCAAPGNKTAQIGVALGNRGTVVANDRNAGRLYALHDTIERLGLLNVSVTIHDGTNLPPAMGLFDHVLVDAPCSCEGTSRKHPSVLDQGPTARPGSLAGVQRALLHKAVDLCRPGGRVVYSTCTYAPEENEAVVDAVLRDRPNAFRIIPADVAGLDTAPGLTEWSGRRFQASLSGSVRLWPHANDTGGFYVAVLERQ